MLEEFSTQSKSVYDIGFSICQCVWPYFFFFFNFRKNSLIETEFKYVFQVNDSMLLIENGYYIIYRLF